MEVKKEGVPSNNRCQRLLGWDLSWKKSYTHMLVRVLEQVRT